MQTLNRNEMKNIIAGTGPTMPQDHDDYCICSHNGCDAHIRQYASSWTLEIQCPGQNLETYNGTGEYGGTVCGGEC